MTLQPAKLARAIRRSRGLWGANPQKTLQTPTTHRTLNPARAGMHARAAFRAARTCEQAGGCRAEGQEAGRHPTSDRKKKGAPPAAWVIINGF